MAALNPVAKYDSASLIRTVTEIAERALARNKKRTQISSHQASETQLPVWPDMTRGVPNGVLRSALFGAIKKGPRPFLQREKIAALGGINVHYTGQRLDQGDLDVWENVLHFARNQKLGDRCRFTAYSMLKLLGITDTGKNRQTLHKRLLRLKANGVEIVQGNIVYIGSLIDEVYKDVLTSEYAVILNEKICPLFGGDQFTRIDWAIRRELGGHPLAQWLHGFYSTHAKPLTYKVATLNELCGSSNSDLNGFKRDMQKALDAIGLACKKHGQYFRYELNGNRLDVYRQPTATQKRHLAKKLENMHARKRKNTVPAHIPMPS